MPEGVSSTTEQKRQWIQNYKLEHGCARCGWAEHSDALELHHLDPDTKLFALGLSCATRSWDVIFAEIEKCEVLCVRCHRVETAESRAPRLPVREVRGRPRKSRDKFWWLSYEEIQNAKDQIDALIDR